MENNFENSQNQNFDARKEFEKKRFIENLEQKEQELNKIEINSDFRVKKAKKNFQNKVTRIIIMTILLIVFCIGLSKAFYHIASNVSIDNNISTNTTVVEIAVMNYKNDKGTYPVDYNNKVNVSLLRQQGYLNSDVENNCGCEFYLNSTNKTLTAKKIK